MFCVLFSSVSSCVCLCVICAVFDFFMICSLSVVAPAQLEEGWEGQCVVVHLPDSACDPELYTPELQYIQRPLEAPVSPTDSETQGRGSSRRIIISYNMHDFILTIYFILTFVKISNCTYSACVNMIGCLESFLWSSCLSFAVCLIVTLSDSLSLMLLPLKTTNHWLPSLVFTWCEDACKVLELLYSCFSLF